MRVIRLLPALVPALLCAAVGCGLFEGGRTAHRYDGPGPARGASSAGEAVYLDLAVVERPRGDTFLDQEVWQAGDEQGIDLELKPALEENGLRVCQFGVLPDRLQAVLKSERYCSTPRRLRGEPDRPSPLQVGPVRPGCAFTVQSGGEAKPVSVEQARCEFEVVPTLEDEGQIRLRFTPRVRHGKARMKPQVARDPDGQLRWSVEPAEPTEEFDRLRFELRVGSGEYVAVGTWHDREDTLGHAFFLPTGQATQYLLVVRASRVSGDEVGARAVAPLAVQAGQANARGTWQ